MISFDLDNLTPVASACCVRFLTPTELRGHTLKSDGLPEDAMPFGVLFARIRDRIGALSCLYQNQTLSPGAYALSEIAADVRTVSSHLQCHEVWRRSSRTGALHGIGGFMGSVNYQGNLGPLLPYLKAASWTGVGRHTVWGNGAIEVDDAR
jgi:hypothetical protein